MKLALPILLACACINEISPEFLDFRPLSVTREWNLQQTAGPKKLPIHDFMELVERHGYPSEEHEVRTVDGYRLRIHRIPGGPGSPKAPGKPVVYVQHGLLSSSDMFVLDGPGQDLPYILADAGYDVWLGNARGNTYSRSHIKLSPNDPQFWDFSFHEIAIYDIPATIDYILHETNQKSVIYVAHSMGTTAGLVLLSSQPKYNSKIRVVINMATIGNWKKPRNIMKFFYSYGHFIMAILKSLRIQEVLPQSLGSGRLLYESCREGSIFQQVCLATTYFVCGYNPDLDTRRLAQGVSYFPAGASSQTLIHYYQNIVAGKLQMYDYGVIRNYATYKQFTPPVYNLKNVVAPVILIYGKGDAVAGPEDSIDLLNYLPNAKAEGVPHEYFNHLDFVWAKNVSSLLHNRIFQIIQRSMSFTRIEDL